MWLPIMEDLCASYRAAPDLNGVVVGIGVGATENQYPGIDLSWEDHDDTPHAGNRRTLTLYADCFIRNDDPDPLVAYQALYDLQERHKWAFFLWLKSGIPGRLGIAIRAAGLKTLSDNEQYRPEYGSRTIITLEYQGGKV